MKQWMVVVGLYVSSLNASASQLIRLEVEQNKNVYSIYVEMDVDAPVEAVLAVLTDYEKLNRLSDSIVESKVLNTGNAEVIRVQTQIKNCVLFFCMDIKKIEDIKDDKNGRITTDLVADSSNFRSGHAVWDVKSTSHGSRIVHQATLEPDLWIPSWIGTAIVENSLRRELQQSFKNLECLSRADCTKEQEADEVVSIYDESDDDFI